MQVSPTEQSQEEKFEQAWTAIRAQSAPPTMPTQQTNEGNTMTDEQKKEATRAICDVVREYVDRQGVDAEIDAAKVTAVAEATASAIVAGCLKINSAGE